jgi:carboxypeptidase D
MAHLNPDPFPTSYYYGYFNRAWVQKALGVPVNFTTISLLSNNLFVYKTGDSVRTPGLKSLEFLLEKGVKVSMMYGDRDYRCPWNGAEALSLAAKWSGAAEFSRAGYEYVQTNDTYQGGVVRQHGNLFFTRIFEAGHIGEYLATYSSSHFSCDY